MDNDSRRLSFEPGAQARKPPPCAQEWAGAEPRAKGWSMRRTLANELFTTIRRAKIDDCKLKVARPAGLEPATSWFVAVNPFVDPAQLTSLGLVSRVATWTQSWTQFPTLDTSLERSALRIADPWASVVESRFNR